MEKTVGVVMTKVYVAAENIVSPLGLTAQANFDRLLAGDSGIRRQPGGFFASALPEELLRPAAASAGLAENTRFEQLIVLSIKDALSRTKVPIGDPRTAFILSTTKGNIALLEQGKAGQPGASMLLHATAAQVAKTVGAAAQPIVVSNACISGLLAILIAQRLIRAGQYDHAVVCGADELTRFVLSGFQSFQAVSDEPCRPFDAARKGVTLGEGAATVGLTKDTTCCRPAKPSSSGKALPATMPIIFPVRRERAPNFLLRLFPRCTGADWGPRKSGSYRRTVPPRCTTTKWRRRLSICRVCRTFPSTVSKATTAIPLARRG